MIKITEGEINDTHLSFSDIDIEDGIMTVRIAELNSKIDTWHYINRDDAVFIVNHLKKSFNL